jgi:SAM-dependent methyltransferase
MSTKEVRAEFESRSIGSSPYELFPAGAFTRDDESDDAGFYERDRFVDHLDSVALATVAEIIGNLTVEDNPVVLDLMAGWDSHIPARVKAEKVTGLGMNRNELTRNKRLTGQVIHDLNANPSLPFSDETFDVVLNTVSVDYMVKPFEVFSEVGRILKPGGLFLVIFSNRMFPPKAVIIWRESMESERIDLVKRFFDFTGAFLEPEVFISSGRPRPPDDKYYYTGLPSDPVYAVYAEKRGGDASRRRRPVLSDQFGTTQSEPECETDSQSNRGSCPHCGGKLSKWAVPNSPFNTWDIEFLLICFNDSCPYLVRGWKTMNEQGNPGRSYRYALDPVRRSAVPIPIISLHALKDGIVEGEG